MPASVLKNGGFEADWGDEESHRCVVFPKEGAPFERDVGNIFVSPHWTFWFYHDPGTYDQPEGRDAWKRNAPERVRSGEKAYMWFTFNRSHDAGLFQQVDVGTGARVRFTAWMHAWSNGLSEADGGKPSNGRWSDGAGFEHVAWEAGTLPHDTGDKWEDAKPNFTFWVGIDPTGGTDPRADTVIWGQGYHIYNGYVKQLEAQATAESDVVTVFVRSKTLWAFKHNDAYIDDAELVVLEPGETPPEVRLTHLPANLKVGDTAVLEAHSLSSLSDVGLLVKQPSGRALDVGDVVVGRDGDWHTWTYSTAPLDEVGVHAFTFTASGGVRASAAFDCAPVVRLNAWPGAPGVGDEVTVEARSLTGLTDVGLEVTQPSGAKLGVGNVAVGRDGDWRTWTYVLAPAEEAGPHTIAFSTAGGGVQATMTVDYAPAPVGEGRGDPRVQYERTYVLLPPDADSSWALAVVKATWNRHHYTVGGSADDAGIGDLDARRVIAVNPQKWTDDLRAFFAKHYPDVEYIPVSAGTPDELVHKLERL